MLVDALENRVSTAFINRGPNPISGRTRLLRFV